MTTVRNLLLWPMLLVLVSPCVAHDQVVGFTPEEVKFGHVKRLGEAVVLHGDPSRPEPYAVRIKVGPNNVTMPHSHPKAEGVTVISGWIGFGIGPVFDKEKGRVLHPGSFLHLPARVPHFAWTGPEGAVIQAHGIGPFP